MYLLRTELMILCTLKYEKTELSFFKTLKLEKIPRLKGNTGKGNDVMSCCRLLYYLELVYDLL